MNTSFTKTNPGKVFKPDRGKLYVFKKDAVQVMKTWPTVLAWQKSQSKPYWQPVRPDLKLPKNDVDITIKNLNANDDKIELIKDLFDANSSRLKYQSNHLQLCLWANQIPHEIRELVYLYSTRQWHMLSFLARCGQPAKDLINSNPAIAYMLASNWVFHKPAVKNPMRAARNHANKKHKDLLKWLGFPPQKSIQHILKKIAIPSIRVDQLLYLRDLLHSNDCKHQLKIMAHAPRLNSGALRIITDHEFLRLITPKLLFKIANNRKEDINPKLYYRLKSLSDYLQILFPQKGLNFRKRSIGSLERLRDLEQCAELEFIRFCSHTNKKLFLPPIPGTSSIIPLQSTNSIIEEGDEMENCVMRYIPKILAYQNYYIYRVVKPERCTLSIRKFKGYWKLDQIKTFSNRRVSNSTLKKIGPWLLKHQLISGLALSEMINNNSLLNYRQTNDGLLNQSLPEHDDAPF